MPALESVPSPLDAEKGVTAYLQRPVQRERLNERFLKSTIRSVQSCECELRPSTGLHDVMSQKSVCAASFLWQHDVIHCWRPLNAANRRAEEAEAWDRHRKQQQQRQRQRLRGQVPSQCSPSASASDSSDGDDPMQLPLCVPLPA